MCYAGQQSGAQAGDVNAAMRIIAPNKSLLKSCYHPGVLFDMLHASAVLCFLCNLCLQDLSG